MEAGGREEFVWRVSQELKRASRCARRQKRLDFWLLGLSIIGGGIAALVAGGTAWGGAEMAERVGGWRIVCYVAAACSSLGAVCGTLHKTFRVSDRLAKAAAGSTRLKSLELALLSKAIDLPAAAKEFRQILDSHPEVFAEG